MTAPDKLPIVVLISGGGTNLQALIDAVARGELPAEIRAVISNRAGAYGLVRAERAGIPTEVVDHRRFGDRDRFDRTLQERIDAYSPGLVVLAGFMRILSAGFVNHYRGRIMNIHPSLLPDLRGLNTHQRALAEGLETHGASVHFVTDELDGGPVIVQAPVPVHRGDTPDVLAARVLEQEHRIYPLAIRWFAEGRLRMDDSTIRLDGKPLTGPCRFDPETGTVDTCDS